MKFETFAVPRIRGAIFDGLRSLDWVPRSVRSRAREVERAIAELEAATAGAPTDDELAEHLKIIARPSSSSGCRRSPRRRSARSTGRSSPAPSRGR